MACGGGCAGSCEGHFRAHNGGAILRTLLYDVVGTGVLTSNFWVSDEASMGFMVGKDIGSDTRREVNSEDRQSSIDWSPNRVSLGAPSRLAGVAILVPCTK